MMSLGETPTTSPVTASSSRTTPMILPVLSVPISPSIDQSVSDLDDNEVNVGDDGNDNAAVPSDRKDVKCAEEKREQISGDVVSNQCVQHGRQRTHVTSSVLRHHQRHQQHREADYQVETGLNDDMTISHSFRACLERAIRCSNQQLLEELDQKMINRQSREENDAVGLLKFEMDRLHAALEAEQVKRQQVEVNAASLSRHSEKLEAKIEVLQHRVDDLQAALDVANAKKCDLLAEKMLLRKQVIIQQRQLEQGMMNKEKRSGVPPQKNSKKEGDCVWCKLGVCFCRVENNK